MWELVAPVDLAALAAALPWRGDAERLQEIAAWGAAVADLAEPGCGPARRGPRREAALFNLAAALFDSVVDRAAPSRDAVARALEPAKLHGRLAHPHGDAWRLSLGGPAEVAVLAEAAVVQMFDIVVSSAGTRWSGHSGQLWYLGDLLERMFLSEMGVSSDWPAAKRLPVVFMGALTYPVSDSRAASFFDALGQFLALWDDWLDLADDLATLRPNAFLGPGSSAGALGALVSVGRGVSRVVRGRRGRLALSAALGGSMQTVLEAGERMGPATLSKTTAFLGGLLE